MRKGKTPTQRSLELLRKRGYLAESVEKFVRFPPPGHRVDLFNFIDIVAIRGNETLAVQTTVSGKVQDRIDKIRNTPAHLVWLSPPHRQIHVHGWGLKGPYGKRKIWQCLEVAFPK